MDKRTITEDFLKQEMEFIIQDNEYEKFDITEDDKKDIINNLIYDDYLWEFINNKILYQLEDYIEEDI